MFEITMLVFGIICAAVLIVGAVDVCFILYKFVKMERDAQKTLIKKSIPFVCISTIVLYFIINMIMKNIIENAPVLF